MRIDLHNPQKPKLEELDEQEKVRTAYRLKPFDRYELERMKHLHAKLPVPWVASETANGGRYYVAELSKPGARGIWDNSGTASEDVCELIALLRNKLPYFIELAEKDLET